VFQRNTNFQPNKSRSAGFICRSLFIVKPASKPSQPNSGHDPWSSPANLISVGLQPPAAQPVCEFQPRTASQPKHQPSQPNIGHGPWSSPANLISVGLKPPAAQPVCYFHSAHSERFFSLSWFHPGP